MRSMLPLCWLSFGRLCLSALLKDFVIISSTSCFVSVEVETACWYIYVDDVCVVVGSSASGSSHSQSGGGRSAISCHKPSLICADDVSQHCSLLGSTHQYSVNAQTAADSLTSVPQLVSTCVQPTDARSVHSSLHSVRLLISSFFSDIVSSLQSWCVFF